MVEIVKEKNLIKIGNEPVVILPLKKWEKIEETIEDLEDAVRFNTAFRESRNQKGTTLKELKRRYNLK